MRPAIHRVQEFNGIRFYKKPSGYYKAQQKHGGAYMHRYVWEHANGPIPQGHQVHHKNHLRADCSIGNLELLPGVAHAKHHSGLVDREFLRERMRAVMQPLAAKWHGSDAGREFHAALGKHSWAVRDKQEYTCAHCGGAFEAHVNAQKRGFCSAKCQSAARRASGIDNITLPCPVCNAPFTKNKYSRQATCSKSCGGKAKSQVGEAR